MNQSEPFLRDYQQKTRLGKLVEIEQAIVNLCPDYMEAQDLLDALKASLEKTYSEKDLQEVSECHRWYMDALNKADSKRVKAPDEMTLAKEKSL